MKKKKKWDGLQNMYNLQTKTERKVQSAMGEVLFAMDTGR